MARPKNKEPHGVITLTLGQTWINKLDDWCGIPSPSLSRRSVIEQALKHYFDTGVQYRTVAERERFTHCQAFTFEEKLAAATTLAELPEMPDQNREWPNYQLFVKKRAELYREESARKKAAEKAAKEAQTASDVPAGEDWL
jgi:hypothetical protein